MSASRGLNPEYAYRVSFNDIQTIYHRSGERAFDDGNFLTAAQFSEEQSELRGCSLILSGLLQEGLQVLDKFPNLSDRSKLCKAFALWSLDRDAEAKAAIKLVDDPTVATRAQRFRDLLERSDITVFVSGAFLSIFPEQNMGSVMAPVFQYGPITAKYVASQMVHNAYDYRIGDSFDDFIGSLPDNEQPDFIFSLSPLWLLARDFHKVKAPKVLWCHDTDVFLYRNVENFALYDVGICSCAQEHIELSRTSGLFCATNMMSNPLNTPFPEAGVVEEKKFDIVFTGSALSDFHTEKPRFMYQLAELGIDYKIRVVDGYLSEKAYFELLAQSKFLPIVNRYADAPSPRWRDALTNGAGLLHPEGTLFSQIPGCFPYRAESISADIRGHLERFDTGVDPAYDLARLVGQVNTRFAIYRQPREKMFERLLKYAAFLALVWRDDPVERTQQRRAVWLTPTIDAGLYGHQHVRQRIDELTENNTFGDLNDERDYNNAAQCLVKLALSYPDNEKLPIWEARAESYFRTGLKRFPNSLLLRFNRAYWMFFRPDADYEVAEAEFIEIIKASEEFDFDANGADIGCAYTLNERDAIFPYYDYADLLTREMLRRGTPELRDKEPGPYSPRDVILSACHGYIGWSLLKREEREGALARFEQAIKIFPKGLPILRLRLDTLLDLCKTRARLQKAEVMSLADAFYAVANQFPAVLLTHIVAAVPLLVRGGEADAARDLLASWYRLGNIVHTLDTEQSAHRQIDKLKLLGPYKSLLPIALLGRIARNRRTRGDDLSQLEQFMDEALRRFRREKSLIYHLGRRVRKLGRAVRHLGLRWIALAFAMWRVVEVSAVWWRVPFEVKCRYVKRAFAILRQGELRRVGRLVRQWGSLSQWAQPRDE
ncbi:MAG: hypothetical protein JWL84_5557 [Rhodospirillales bacterium]|nr:hypothetical protein [Rhodospirillales bacterium]